MEMRFEDRAQAWRGRGRPPRQPSAKIVETLRNTARTGTIAIIPCQDATPEEIRELKADLRAAERAMGGKVRHQIVNGEFKFYWEVD